MFDNRAAIDDVCRRFDLGTARAAPVAVAGGLSNRLYHLVTELGEFALKRMVANAHAPEFKRNVEAAFAIERLAQAAGIAMPEPIPVAGSDEALGLITDDEGPCWVRVHRWVEASPVDPGNLEPRDRAEVGAILAALHGLPLIDDATTTPVAAGSMPDRDWTAALAAHPFAVSLAGPVSVFEEIVRRGYGHPRSGPVLSHRDLDAKNLLRDGQGRLILLDWDAAGPTDAQWDVIGVAMDWSGIREGTASSQRFADILDGYSVAGGSVDPVTPASFAGWCEGVLDWLWFNVERSSSTDRHERHRGELEVNDTARFLPLAAAWITSERYPVAAGISRIRG